MPGGRLTRQDRLRIAEGLAEGLSYTEIAVRLERPLSTVSREVARNGGPEGYRAERAHQDTRERARRQRPAAVERDAPAVGDLEERFAEIMVGGGLSPMTARVLSALYLTDSGALTAAELAAHLRVSPASISKAVGELEQQEMIRRERDPRRRRDRYVIDADALFRGWMASARHNSVVADFVWRGAESLGTDSPAGARLQDIGDFFDHVGRAMLQAAEQWRRDYAAREGGK